MGKIKKPADPQCWQLCGTLARYWWESKNGSFILKSILAVSYKIKCILPI